MSTDFNLQDEITDESIEAAMSGDDTPPVPAPTDVSATDQPASPSEQVEDAPEAPIEGIDDEETPTEPETDTPDKEPEPEKTEPETPKETAQAETLNWESAPQRFRERHEELKREISTSGKLKDAYFEGPEKFLEELHGLSSSQYQQTTEQIVKKGIELAPDDFAAYIASVKPEAVAKAAAQADPQLLADALNLGMPLEKARRIIDQVKRQDLEGYLNDLEDDETPAETPKKAEPAAKSDEYIRKEDLDKIVNERLAEAGKPQKVELLRERVYGDIMAPVEEALKEAGLAPDANDSDDDKNFKAWASEQIIKDTFSYLFDNEKNAAQSKKAIEFIENLDENGVKHLLPLLKIKAEDYALEKIALLTNKRADAKTKPTKTKKEPHKVVPSSGAVPAFGAAAGAAAVPIGELSEDDFAAVGI